MSALIAEALPRPNKSRWETTSAWRLIEAAFLLSGMEPLEDASGPPKSGSPARMYSELKRSVVTGNPILGKVRALSPWLGNWYLKPTNCIAWAISMKFEIPPELKDIPVAEIAEVDSELVGKARSTALRLIYCMAVSRYSYDSETQRSKVPRLVQEDLQRLGMRMNQDTIRDWLQESAEMKPPPEK